MPRLSRNLHPITHILINGVQIVVHIPTPCISTSQGPQGLTCRSWHRLLDRRSRWHSPPDALERPGWMLRDIHRRWSHRQWTVTALLHGASRDTTIEGCGRSLIEHAPVIFHSTRLSASDLPSCIEARGNYSNLHLA